MTNKQYQEKLEKILKEIHDAYSFMRANRTNKELAENYRKAVNQLNLLFLQVVEEAKPEKTEESDDPDVNLYYETGNYDDTYEIGQDVGFNKALDQYEQKLKEIIG